MNNMPQLSVPDKLVLCAAKEDECSPLGMDFSYTHG